VTTTRCDANLYHMETVSIRDLRYHFPKVQRLLEHGEAIQITKRKRVIGTLFPATPFRSSQPARFPGTGEEDLEKAPSR
jgi:antitoxin (DNA-binding transcriptional repressor) of toxin-antitoxin stability system